MSKRRRILGVFGVLAAVLALWIAATIFLSPAYAGALPFSMEIRSGLMADYNPDSGKSLFTALRLSILGDSLRDQGLSEEEAEKQRLALEASLDDPVPTATALDFEGSAPLTATATTTPVPTGTPIPSATPTNTPRPTNTKVPTKTKTPKPAATSAPADSSSPVVAAPGTISPAPGPSSSCNMTVSVSNATITDAAPSSGIKSVKLKYKVYDNAEKQVYAGYIFSPPLSLCSGGPTAGGGWDACYSGGINISIYPGFSSLGDYNGPGPFKVKLYLLAEDNAGKQASHFYGDYTMPMMCDDPPPPTNTPTPTNTPLPTDTTPPSILSFTLIPAPGASAPGTTITSCTIEVSDLHVFDPAFSSGVSASNVQLKYSSPTVSWTPISLTLKSGGWTTGLDWDAHYGDFVTFSGVKTNEVIQVEGRVEDDAKAGGWQYTNTFYFKYTGSGC